jgi:hypothetical protein
VADGASRLIPRHRRGEVFAVTAAALLAWHRRPVTRKWDYANRWRTGRPSTAAVIRKLVIRIATDNPTRGTGECKAKHPERSLGHHHRKKLRATRDYADRLALPLESQSAIAASLRHNDEVGIRGIMPKST